MAKGSCTCPVFCSQAGSWFFPGSHPRGATVAEIWGCLTRLAGIVWFLNVWFESRPLSFYSISKLSTENNPTISRCRHNCRIQSRLLLLPIQRWFSIAEVSVQMHRPPSFSVNEGNSEPGWSDLEGGYSQQGGGRWMRFYDLNSTQVWQGQGCQGDQTWDPPKHLSGYSNDISPSLWWNADDWAFPLRTVIPGTCLAIHTLLHLMLRPNTSNEISQNGLILHLRKCLHHEFEWTCQLSNFLFMSSILGVWLRMKQNIMRQKEHLACISR